MKKYRGVFLKNEREIGLLREANRMVACILDELGKEVRPGLPTMYFEEIVQKMCREFKVKPGFQGMYGFPYALCCSINEEVVHGFPSEDRILQEGDIVSFDVGTIYQGFFGDAARTFAVGKVSAEAEKLMRVTSECLELGVSEARTGNELRMISAAVQKHAEDAGCGVIRQYVGHGLGTNLHEKPEVPNFVMEGHGLLPLKVGMVLCIEPMISLGSSDVEVLEDKWTAVTRDRSLAAHFEHSVAILPGGPQILDRP
ncbi:MAG: type I methionyl aminopeptidase [Desulfovibrionaceae bacterium]|nr:type I methionyl aminopeptidase [Desulfovibrionaceae bacterium]